VATECRDRRYEEARGIPPDELARALGLEAHRDGRDLALHCIMQGDNDRKPSLKPWGQGLWKCQSARCGWWGDNTDLVLRVRGGTKASALEWLAETFPYYVSPASSGPLPEAYLQWAGTRGRGIRPFSLRAYGVEVRDGELWFPMRREPGAEITGWQKRRADGTGFPEHSGAKSVCVPGSACSLFMPSDWPKPGPEDVLQVVEGEPDALTGYCLGIWHTVGTHGEAWGTALEHLRALADPFQARTHRVIVPHGDVPEAMARERADQLQARVVWVPVSVAREPGKRDLNEWVNKDGPTVVRETILGNRTGSYTVLYDNAVELIEGACQPPKKPQKWQYRWQFREFVRYCLQNVRLDDTREYRAITVKGKPIQVGPGQLAITRSDIEERFDVPNHIAREFCGRLAGGGIARADPIRGNKGTLLTFHQPSQYFKQREESS